MKLADIDVLNTWRAEYNRRVGQVRGLQNNMNVAPQFGGQMYGELEFVHAIKQAITPVAQKRLDEAKSKLMMLGVDEFPE